MLNIQGFLLAAIVANNLYHLDHHRSREEQPSARSSRAGPPCLCDPTGSVPLAPLPTLEESRQGVGDCQ